MGLIDADLLAKSKPGLRLVNTARGGIVDEAVLAAAIEKGQIAGAAIDVFATEPTTESPLFGLSSVVVTPHLGASTVEAQDKAGQTIAEQVVLALRGEFVPFAVNLAATEANATVQPFLPLVERLGRLFTGLAGGIVDTLEIGYEGQIADYDCRVLTLGVLKGVLAPVVDEPVSFVNAPQLAESRGLTVRETKVSSVVDYVNLVELRGVCAGRPTHVAGTLYGKQAAPRIVGIDEHIVDVPPSSHMLVVRNADVPGMIGKVGTILGNAGVNVDDMDVGKTAEGRGRAHGDLDHRAGRRRGHRRVAGAGRRRRRPRHRARLALGGAEAVGDGGVGVDVAALGADAVVVAPAGLVEDPARQLRLDGMRQRAAAVVRLHPRARVRPVVLGGTVGVGLRDDAVLGVGAVGLGIGRGGAGNGLVSNVTPPVSGARDARKRHTAYAPPASSPAMAPRRSSFSIESCSRTVGDD